MTHRGQPTKYTEKLATAICTRLCDGESLLRICRDKSLPARSTVYLWLLSKPEFSDKYSLAREIQADVLADEILDIADDEEGDATNPSRVRRAQLRVNARQWYAAKVAPRKYSDKQAIEMSGPNGAPINPVTIYLPQKGSIEKKKSV